MAWQESETVEAVVVVECTAYRAEQSMTLLNAKV